MSLIDGRNYFRSHMNALGFTEWKDAFNWRNIPATKIDKSYHITSGTIAGESLNMNDQVLGSEIVVRFWIKGHLDPAAAIDSAHNKSEALITEALKASNRGTYPIGNIGLNIIDFLPFGETNDNIIMCEMSFTIRLNLSIN